MLRNRRIFPLASLMVVTIMIITACGGGAPAAPTAAPAAPTTAPAAPTTAPAAPTTAPAAPTTAPTTAAPEATTAVTGTTGTMMKFSAPDCSYLPQGAPGFKSIEAVDNLTVKFTLCEPDAAFMAKIAFATNEIQSAKHLQDTSGGGPALTEHPLGTGPYMVQEWVRGDHITLVANPNYWGTPPKVKTVVVKWNKEAAARLTSLKSGEADGIDNPDPHDYQSIQSDSTLKLYNRPALNVFYLGFNNTKPPLDNEKVRQAIAMGIDRKAIVDKFYPAGSTVADYFTPCQIPGGCEGDPWYQYDLNAAKKMLSDAGFASGFSIKLSYRNVVRGYLPAPDKVAEELQAQLKKLGITATIDQQESGTFLDNASKGNLEMYLLGWGADYPDQTDFLDYHFGTGASDQFGKKFDDLTAVLAKAATTTDQKARLPLYAQANGLVKQHVPMVPIAHGASATAFKASVQGAYADPLSGERFALMDSGKDTMVFIQNGEPAGLYCADETDGEALRVCEQILDPLVDYKPGSGEVVPSLADLPTANADGTVWTVKLHSGVKFSDGTPLTANDVVETFVVQWDASNPLHVGNTGNFDYWSGLFGAFLNPKKK